MNVVKSNETISTYEMDYWKVLRLFSIYRLSRVFLRRNMTLARIYFQLAFWLLTLIMIFTCTMLTVENRWCVTLIERRMAIDSHYQRNYWEKQCPEHKYVFHIMLYFTIVTITTTGYGDISPNTIPGMILFVLLFLSLLVIVVPIF